ncbi:oryzain gamma chain-like [Asparagus officinalis]|uniref:oryzain gamma chain-like n=1 Tax=Asparagus officinalis TaxID=4686 RepID=UPI00098DFA58|nr:oryzain gamma chain-like [Asparagus officinalis]
MSLFAAVIFLLAVAFASSAAAAGSQVDKELTIPPAVNGEGSLENSFLRVLGRTPDALHFARFARKYEKKYETEQEITRRFKIFGENLDLIRSTNRKQLSYKLGINRYADLSWEEFQATRLGAAQNCSATLKGNHEMTSAPLPETKDWRKDGIVSPVKDQGGCGSCWTFSATGSLEAAYSQATGKSISLSEQQLVDCASAFNNFGCNGGLPSQAFEYIKYNGGLDTEESYPYTAVNGNCSFKQGNVGVKLLDSVNITLGAEDELKHAVGVVRPVSVAFEVVQSFALYKGGVYTSDTCGSSSMDVNHAVVAVGYGVENGMPYWLIKNSWGADWGMDGYFRMNWQNHVGVATCASYPIVAP